MYIQYDNISYIYTQYTCWTILYWHIGAGWPSKRPDIFLPPCPIIQSYSIVPQENVVTYPGVKGNFLRFQLQSPINRTGNTWHIQAGPAGPMGLGPKGLTCVWSMVLLWGKWWSTTLLFYRYPAFRTNPSNGRLRDALSRFQQKRTAPILEVSMHCKWNWTFILSGFDSSWNLAHPWWIFLQSSANSRIF